MKNDKVATSQIPPSKRLRMKTFQMNDRNKSHINNF